MFEFCKKLVAVANFSGAMEAETIQKNAVSPKNLRSRGNFLKTVNVVSLAIILFMFTACESGELGIVNTTWVSKNVDGTFKLHFSNKTVVTFTGYDNNVEAGSFSGTYTKNNSTINMTFYDVTLGESKATGIIDGASMKFFFDDDPTFVLFFVKK